MKIKEIAGCLEKIAPGVLQETYDNAGMITGNADWDCTGALVALDATEAVITEAINRNCNLVVAHHPIVFSGLKKITGKSYVEKAVIAAIKNDIAIYAIHTNLDNVLDGVNGKIASILGLINRRVLQPRAGVLHKLAVFVPASHAENLRNELFKAGAGNIGNYSDCSFSTNGQGTFKAGAGTNPFVGKEGERHTENETKIEVVFQSWLQEVILKTMLQAHPYEEVAYDILALQNTISTTGSGLVGELPEAISELAFLGSLKELFGLQVIRHTRLMGKPVKTVAVCGGAGSFLIKTAATAGADFYITSDVKYHEFFDAEDQMVIADIGHYESEQYSIDLVFDILKQKYPTFAVLKTEINTNPVRYFL